VTQREPGGKEEGLGGLQKSFSEKGSPVPEEATPKESKQHTQANHGD
jgi:hypothetical protein